MILTTQLFASYAGKSASRWKEVIGLRVIHTTFGEGVITDVNQYIHISFGAQTKEFLLQSLSDSRFFVGMELPQHLAAREDLKVMVQEGEVISTAVQDRAQPNGEDRKLQTIAAFAELKLRYHAGKISDLSPEHPLYAILVKFDSGATLDSSEMSVLVQLELFGTVAMVMQKQFNKSNDPWDLIKAGANWRKAGRPQKTLELTETLQPANSDQAAARLTTRGAALRALGELTLAEESAHGALEFNPHSPHAHRLLAAIYYQAGKPEDGDHHMVLAIANGVQQRDAEFDLQSAIQNAVPHARRATVMYLLQKDRKRYGWTAQYI